MNDRYLFRAKRIDNGEWAQGYLFDDGFENGRVFVGGLVIEEYHGTACDDWSITGVDFYEVFYYRWKVWPSSLISGSISA